MNSVLIIDDDKELCALMKKCVEQENLSAVVAHGGLEGLRLLEKNKDTCSLIILDVMMPKMNGWEVCREIRQTSKVPIIMLTARSEDADKLMGFACGADDYVTKPFGMGELMARMRVCLRRAGNKEGEPILTCGGLQLNLLEHRVVVEGREVKLTPTEYELLKVMLKYAGRVLTHKQLLKAVWGNEYDTDTHYIRIYMRQLRRKIEPDPAQPKYLITEAGIGYRLLGGE